VNVRKLFSRVEKVIDAYPKSADLQILLDPDAPKHIYVKGDGDVSV
jgi:hypothetical protein